MKNYQACKALKIFVMSSAAPTQNNTESKLAEFADIGVEVTDHTDLCHFQ